MEKLGADRVGGWDKINEAFDEVMKETRNLQQLLFSDKSFDVLSVRKIFEAIFSRHIEPLADSTGNEGQIC